MSFGGWRADRGAILNGDQVVVAQIAMASIRNADTMIASGNNNFSLARARPVPPSDTGKGGGNHRRWIDRASTVDIAREFTTLSCTSADIRRTPGNHYVGSIKPGHYQPDPLAADSTFRLMTPRKK